LRDMSARRSHDRPQPTTSARAPFVARLAVALVAVGLVTFLTWWGIRRWPALTAPKIGEGAPNATANGNKPANGDENPTLDVEVSSSATAPLLTPRMAATGGDEPGFLDTLAAAYAEAGKFSEAVKTAQRALAAATAKKQVDVTDQIESRLKIYQRGEPYRSE